MELHLLRSDQSPPEEETKPAVPRVPMTAKHGGPPPGAAVSHGERRRSHSGESPRVVQVVLGARAFTAYGAFRHGQLLPCEVPRSSATPPCTRRHGGEGRRSCPSSSLHEKPRAQHLHGQAGRDSGRGVGLRHRDGKGGGVPAAYKKLLTVPEEACESRVAKRAVGAAARPGCYVLAFGSVRVPAETDMRDMRRRMRRQGPPASVISSVVGSAAGSTSRRNPGRRPGRTWKLLRSLSCQGDANGAVATPLSFGSM